jgi:hypothetical protein
MVPESAPQVHAGWAQHVDDEQASQTLATMATRRQNPDTIECRTGGRWKRLVWFDGPVPELNMYAC